jgi:hypothetical protein
VVVVTNSNESNRIECGLNSITWSPFHKIHPMLWVTMQTHKLKSTQQKWSVFYPGWFNLLLFKNKKTEREKAGGMKGTKPISNVLQHKVSFEKFIFEVLQWFIPANNREHLFKKKNTWWFLKGEELIMCLPFPEKVS